MVSAHSVSCVRSVSSSLSSPTSLLHAALVAAEPSTTVITPHSPHSHHAYIAHVCWERRDVTVASSTAAQQAPTTAADAVPHVFTQLSRPPVGRSLLAKRLSVYHSCPPPPSSPLTSHAGAFSCEPVPALTYCHSVTLLPFPQYLLDPSSRSVHDVQPRTDIIVDCEANWLGVNTTRGEAYRNYLHFGRHCVISQSRVRQHAQSHNDDTLHTHLSPPLLSSR